MNIEEVNSLCRGCGNKTRHDILGEHKTNGHDKKDNIDFWNEYQIVRCRGCDTIGFRAVHSSSEEYNQETGLPEEFVELYPDPTVKRKPIDGDNHFPDETFRIYRETLSAISFNLPLLAAVGLRAIVESICLDLKTNTRNLKDGIDELARLGHLSQAQAEYLHHHRFMGNVAAHEIRPPKAEHLVHALNIAEALLTAIYILPTIVAQLDAPSS